MKKAPFEVLRPVSLNAVSVDARMRSWAVLDCLQDAAGYHADALGVGLKQLKESALSWVLSRIRVEMDSFPSYGETLKITTYPSGFDRLFAYRQFVISSAASGRIFGRAGSAWLTLNAENFRPVSPAKHFEGLSDWSFEGEHFFQGESLGKLVPPETPPESPQTWRVSAAWIDYNSHLNNAYYAMLTEDWLSQKVRGLVRMTTLQLNFNGSTSLGEELVCSGVLEGRTFFVSGINAATGKNAFQAAGTWEKISHS